MTRKEVKRLQNNKIFSKKEKGLESFYIKQILFTEQVVLATAHFTYVSTSFVHSVASFIRIMRTQIKKGLSQKLLIKRMAQPFAMQF